MSFSLWSRTRRVLCCVGLTSAVIAAGIVTTTVTTRGQVLALPGATESTVVTVEPTRVLDTRVPVGLNSKLVAATPQNLQITGSIDTWTEATQTKTSQQVVPTGATGVLMNVTAVSPTASGYLSVRPGNATGVPATAGLNFDPGDIIPNAINIALPTTGEINLYYGTANTGATMDVVIDIVGYTTNTGLIDLVNRVTALENSGIAGPQGEPGTNGTNGAAGPAGPAGPLTSSCAATLRWDLPACQAATITVGSFPFGVAYDGTNIYVTNASGSNVSVIDPATNTVTDTIDVGTSPNGVAYDGTNIYVANYGSDNVSVIDPATNTVTATITVGTDPNGVAYDGTNIYVANAGSDNVSVIDPATNTVTATITVGRVPYGVAYDGTNIYVTNSGSDNVSVIDPATNTVTATITVGTEPYGVAYDGTNIYVANNGSGNVSVIDPATNTVTDTIDVGTFPDGVAYDGTNIYVTNYGSGNVSVIDPATNTVTDTITVGSFPIGVAYDGTNIYVTNAGSGNVSKLIPR